MKNVDYIVGVDEVGRGAWAGPIVGAAVAWPAKNAPQIPKTILIKDSKKLQEHQRERAGVFLRTAYIHSIYKASSEAIMCSGIQEANRRCLQGAMKKIIKMLKGKSYKILIDGQPIYSLGKIKHEFIVRGDAQYEAIAAASIIAKTHRDAIMRRLAKKHPQYHFEKNKGYGTREHYSALLQHGLCAVHRKSFEPMKSMKLET